MSWQLFLDDERAPARDGLIVAHSVGEAIQLIKEHGMPDFMTLDHDLGENQPTGQDFLLWLINYMMDNSLYFPPYFTYYIHSQNPPGAENMTALLDNFIEFRREDQRQSETEAAPEGAVAIID